MKHEGVRNLAIENYVFQAYISDTFWYYAACQEGIEIKWNISMNGLNMVCIHGLHFK